MTKYLLFLALLFIGTNLLAMERPQHQEPIFNLSIGEKRTNLSLKNVLSHIFTCRLVTDEDQEKISGLHHYGAHPFISMKHMDGTLVKINKHIWIFTLGDINEFHVGYVIYNGKLFLDSKTFFPSNWSQKKVIEYIQGCQAYKSQKICDNEVQNNYIVLAKPEIKDATPIKIILQEYQNIDNSLFILTLFPLISHHKKFENPEQLRQQLEILALQQTTECQNIKIDAKIKEPKIFDIVNIQDLSSLQKMLQVGVDTDMRNGNNKTPLMAAAQQGNLEMCSALLDFGASKDSEDEKSNTALHYAVSSGSYFTVLGLLNKNCINKKNNEGTTPLIYAISNLCDALKDRKNPSRKEFIDIIALLLHFHADPNIKNKYGRTALISAICDLDNKAILNAVVELLIANGANIDLADDKGTTPCMYAVKYNRLNIVQILLKHHADFQLTNKDGMTALKIAQQQKYAEIASFIEQWIANKAKWIKENGANELIHACFSNDIKTVERLLKLVDLNGQDSNGQTALYYAATNNNERMVDLLIANGADPRIKTFYNETVLEIAQNQHIKKTIIEKLKQEIEKLEAPLKAKEETEKNELKKQIIQFGQEVKKNVLLSNETLKNLPTFLNKKIHAAGYTPLLFAVVEKNIVAVDQILQIPGVDLSIRDSKSNSILNLAYDDLPMMQLLISCQFMPVSLTEEIIKKALDDKYLVLLNIIAKTKSEYLFAILRKLIQIQNLEKVNFILDNQILKLNDDQISILLIESINNNAEDIFVMLLDRYPDMIDYKTKNGKTLLMLAAEINRVKLVEILCTRGANINLIDNDGYTVCELTSSKNLTYSVIANYKSSLKQQQEEIDKRENHANEVNRLHKLGYSPLMIAAHFDDLKAIQNVQMATDTTLLSAIMIAIGQNSMKALEALCKHTAVVNLTDEKGVLPLLYAYQKNNYGAVRILLSAGASVISVVQGQEISTLIGNRMPEFKKIITDAQTRDLINFTKNFETSKELQESFTNTLIFQPANFEKYIKQIVRILISEKRSLAKLCELIKKRCGNGVNPLEICIECEQNIIEALVNSGYKPTAKCFKKILSSKKSFETLRDKVIYLIRNSDVDTLHEMIDGLSGTDSSCSLLTYFSLVDEIEIIEEILNVGSRSSIKANIDRMLAYAAAAGNINTVEHLIAKGANVNYKDNFGITPLIYACKGQGNLQIIKELLKEDVDVAAVDSEGYNALMWALDKKDVDIVLHILSHIMLSLPYAKANEILNKTTSKKITPLKLAFTKGDVDLAAILLVCGAKASPEISENGIPIHDSSLISCADNHSGKVYNALIALTYDVSIALLAKHFAKIEDMELKRIISKKIIQKNFSAVCNLLGGSIDVNAKFATGKTPLTRAIDIGDEELFDYFLDRKDIDINQPDASGITPLSQLARNAGDDSSRMLRMATKLIKAGADLNLVNDQKRTPLMVAIAARDISLAKLLIENGADINLKDIAGYCALSYCAAYDNIEIASLLVSKKADVNCVDILGSSILMRACESGAYKLIKLLIENGANVHLKNKRLDTPLMLLCGRNVDAKSEKNNNKLNREMYFAELEAINALLVSGLDINARDHDGQTALAVAIQMGDPYIAIKLIEFGAPVNNINANNDLALHLCCQKNDNQGLLGGLLNLINGLDRDLFKFILKNKDKYGFNLNAINANGYTPLMIAAKTGLKDKVTALIEAGADVTVLAPDNVTAYSLAMASGHKDIAKLLQKS